MDDSHALAEQPEDSRNGKNDYVVGYGRPPKATRFKPGQSGNPKGRRKKRPNAWEELRDVYTGKVPISVGDKRIHITRLRAVLLKQWERACKGSECATQGVIAMANMLDLLCQSTPIDHGDRINITGEEFESLSAQARLELIRLAEEREKRQKH